MDYKIFFDKKNIKFIHYHHIRKQFYRNNNGKHSDHFYHSYNTKKSKFNAIKDKNDKIINLLYYFIILILLNLSISELTITIQVKQSNSLERILYTKNIENPTRIEPSNMGIACNYQNDYLMCKCNQYQCTIILHWDRYLTNGDEMFMEKKCS